MQFLFMLHALLMLRVKLQMERLYLISEHKMLTMKALPWALHILEGKMTLLLFQLIQVKLSSRGRRLKLLNLDCP